MIGTGARRGRLSRARMAGLGTLTEWGFLHSCRKKRKA